jgi:hypothetical protein
MLGNYQVRERGGRPRPSSQEDRAVASHPRFPQRLQTYQPKSANTPLLSHQKYRPRSSFGNTTLFALKAVD